MAVINHLWFAALTRNTEDAGTDNLLNLTINLDGGDVVDSNVAWMLEQGEAYFLGNASFAPFDTAMLTNSSIRLGIRGDDAWAPEHLFIFGHAPRTLLPLAIETDLDTTLSADADEGHLSMPLRLVTAGNSLTVIRRVLLLVDTSSENDADTESQIQLQITAGGANVLQQIVPQTPQSDLERWRANWYFLDAAVPFTRGDVLANGGITLSILDEDAWLPESVLVFGLDTLSGRPTTIVPLVSILAWDLGWLSTDHTEGKPSIPLPVS
jgi:hypothetical protein